MFLFSCLYLFKNGAFWSFLDNWIGIFFVSDIRIIEKCGINDHGISLVCGIVVIYLVVMDFLSFFYVYNLRHFFFWQINYGYFFFGNAKQKMKIVLWDCGLLFIYWNDWAVKCIFCFTLRFGRMVYQWCSVRGVCQGLYVKA